LQAETAPNIGPIVGGVVGGIAGIVLIVISIFLAFRWGRTKGLGERRDHRMEGGENGEILGAEAEQTGVVREMRLPEK
jgi:hypothetical protein